MGAVAALPRRLARLGVPVLLGLAACAAPEPEKQKAAAPLPPTQPENTADQPDPKTDTHKAPAEEDPYDRALKDFLKRNKIQDEQTEFLAQEHYKLAEKFYQDGKLENAEASAREALKHNPQHAGARALLYEVQILLGRGVEGDIGYRLRRVMNEVKARQEQVRLEIDEKFNLGMRYYNAGQYEDAERSFRLVIEYAKWVFPPSAQVDTRKQQSIEMLQKTKQATRQRELDEARLRRRLIEEEEQIRTMSRIIEQKKEMEILFSQAQLHFEREEYEQTVILCDKLLFMNPNLSSVREMKMVAARLSRMKEDRRNFEKYIQQWKKSQNYMEWLGGIPQDLVEFPDFDTWMEIRARGPRVLKLEEEEALAERDRQVVDKLKSMRLSFEWEDTPLSEVVSFLREATGLNFLFDPAVSPDETVTFSVRDITIDAMLRYILQPLDYTYYVEEGIVHISDAETFALKQVKLEVFDVQDITFRLLDMPGREITFGDAGVQFVDQPAEAQPQWGGEDLVELIRQTVDPRSWDLEGRDILFQNGLLIVRATPDVMKGITQFLTMLRGSTGIMVHVEARFLFVDDNWLQMVGIDFRGSGTSLAGIQPPNPNGVSFLPPFPYFIGDSLSGAADAGFQTTVTGSDHTATIGARVQNLMFNDFMRNKFFQDVLSPMGGGLFTYSLADDVAVDAIIRLLSKKQKGYTLAAPRLTMFNTQRAHIQISNQMAYVKDWNLGGGGFIVIPDPIIDVISDGIVLDVKPIVSADRKYVTMEIRATAALLWPPPPQITQIVHNVFTLVPNGFPTTVELPFVKINQIRTTVVAPDEGVIIMGGIGGYFDANYESGVPVWKHVPIFGQLGKQEVRGKGRQQLIIILRSDIVIPSEEERRRFE